MLRTHYWEQASNGEAKGRACPFKLGSCLHFLPVVVPQEALSLPSWSLYLVPWVGQGFAALTRSCRLARSRSANLSHSPGPGPGQRSPPSHAGMCWGLAPDPAGGHRELEVGEAMPEPPSPGAGQPLVPHTASPPPQGCWGSQHQPCTALAPWPRQGTLQAVAEVTFSSLCVPWCPKAPLSCSLWWHRAGH